MALQGGNDSYGTGLSAGGAQVMGQSKGLDELVKYGMARAKQRMQRPFGVATPNVDMALIKDADSQDIINGVADYRDHGLNAQQSSDFATRLREGTAMNNSYASTLAHIAASKEGQAFAKDGYNRIHNDPNVDSRSLDEYDFHHNNFIKAKTGSDEANSERLLMDSRRFAAYHPSDTQTTLNKFAQDQQYASLQKQADGSTIGITDKTRKANGESMMNFMRNVGAGNINAKHLYEDKGDQFMRDPTNANQIKGFSKEYGIDPKNKAEVGYALDVDANMQSNKLYNVQSDKLYKKSNPLQISVGGAKSSGLPDMHSTSTVNALDKDGKSYKMEINTPTEANESGIAPFSSVNSGRYYNAKNNSWEVGNGLTNVHVIGGKVNMRFYKGDTSFGKADADGVIQNVGANKGVVSKAQSDMMDDKYPAGGDLITEHKNMYHVFGYDRKGKLVERYVPEEHVGIGGYKTTGKGVSAQVSRGAVNTLISDAEKSSGVTADSKGYKVLPGIAPNK